MDTPIAELELYGASRRIINWLDQRGVIYLRQLQQRHLHEMRAVNWIGHPGTRAFIEVLRHHRDGRTTRTEQECTYSVTEDDDED
jgi:hypothetical protein